MVSDLNLGDRVRILGTVEKWHDGARTGYREVPGPPWDCSGPWKKDDGKRTFEHGIVIGKRHPQTGVTRYDLYEGPEFRSDGAVAVYLVAFDLHRRHVMCLPTQLIKEEYIQSDSPIAVDVPRFAENSSRAATEGPRRQEAGAPLGSRQCGDRGGHVGGGPVVLGGHQGGRGDGSALLPGSLEVM